MGANKVLPEGDDIRLSPGAIAAWGLVGVAVLVLSTLALPFRLARELARQAAELLNREREFFWLIMHLVGLLLLAIGAMAGAIAVSAALIGYWETFWHLGPRGLVLIAGGYGLLIGRALWKGADDGR